MGIKSSYFHDEHGCTLYNSILDNNRNYGAFTPDLAFQKELQSNFLYL